MQGGLKDTYLLPQKGACAGALDAVRPAPLGLPGFHLVQPGLEALRAPHSTLVR